MSEEPDNPYAAPAPGWQPPGPPAAPGVPAPPPPSPPYAAPPDWQPPPPPPPPPPSPAAPGWGPPYPGQPYGAPPYGAPPYGAPPYAGQPGYPYGYPTAPASTNGLSIAALVCSLVLSWLFGLGGILGVTFGIIGLRQCRRRGQRGSGLAIAGIVIGGLALAFWLLVLVVGLTTTSGGSGSGNLGALAVAGYRAAWQSSA